MGPDALAQVLRPLQGRFLADQFPNLLVGLEVSDDAAVYQVSDDLAVIQTLDFFPPVVDDPYDYGAIAAANAMSDIYAMGGEVLLALNICSFPTDLEAGVVQDILRGGADKVAEAGGVLAGGHTITDKEPKYGLSVMGTIHPDRILRKGGARPGDVLVLTKPLGAGVITTALKRDAVEPSHIEAATASMSKLNRDASRILQQVEVTACTDITGFALLGHGLEMAERSDAQLLFRFAQLPYLPGARRYARAGMFPGGSCRNQDAYAQRVRFPDDLSEDLRMLLFTPETSGGLLAAVSAETLPGLIQMFDERGVSFWPVGEVRTGQGVTVTL